MDDQKKKNGLIRLLGRLGRRVKFLQKPLMVLVVLGVSIHHLLKKFFFDVNYHATRMRVLMGSLCVALLLTLFVIPAIAGEDEFSLLDVITEEIQTEPTEEPTPTPETEMTEVVDGQQPAQGDESGVPTDGEVAPTDGTVPTDPSIPVDPAVVPDQMVPTDGTGDGTIPTDGTVPGDGTDFTDPLLNENGEPVQPGDTVTGEDGETYEVDDDGNLIDSEGNVADVATTELLRKGPAVKVIKEQPGTPVSVTIEKIDVPADLFANNVSGSLKATALMSSLVQSGTVVFKWYIKKDSGSFADLTGNISSTIIAENASHVAVTTLALTDVVNHTGDVIHNENVGYTGAGTYSFRCDAYVLGNPGEPNSNTKPSDSSTSIEIKNYLIKSTEVTVPLEIRDNKDVHVTVGGISMAKPALAQELSKYETELSDKWVYVLKDTNNELKYSCPAGSSVKVLPGYYKIFLKIDGTVSDCALNAGADGTMDTGKYFQVNYYGDTTEGHCTHTVPAKLIQYTPANPSADTWYNSVKVEPISGYKFITSKDIGASLSTSQSLLLSHGKKETLYVAAENGKYIVNQDISTEEFKIDKAPEGDSNNGAPIVERITFDDYPTEKTYTNKDIKFTIGASDAPESDHDSGKSGLSKIEWKAQKANPDDAGVPKENYASVNGDLGNDSKEYVAEGQDETGWQNTITIDQFDARAYAVFVYVKVTDHAGNVGYGKKKFDLVDVTPPKMSSTKYTELNKYLGQVSKGNDGIYTGKDITIYRVNSDGNIDISIKDDHLKLATITPATGVTESGSGETTEKIFTITPEASDIIYTIKAEDSAGNITLRKIQLYTVDVNPKVEGSVSLGEAVYGYVPADTADQYKESGTSYESVTDTRNGDEVPVVGRKIDLLGKYSESSTIKELGLAIDVDTIEVLSKDKTPVDSFVVTTGEGDNNGTLYVKPKAKLDAGQYSAIVKITYDFKINAAEESSVVIGKHSHEIGSIGGEGTIQQGVSFKVLPTAITLKYPGSEEKYHTRPGGLDKERWCDRLTVDRGLRYDDTESAVKTGESFTVTPKYTVDSNEGLTSDKFVIGENGSEYVLNFTILGNQTSASAGAEVYDGQVLASKNYYFKGGSTASGRVKVLRRKFFDEATGKKNGYTITPISDYNISEDEDRDGKVTSDNPPWYVENMEIKTADGYLVYDVTNSSIEEGYTPYNIPNTEDDSTVKNNFKFTSEPFYDEGDGLPKKKYFYVYDTATGEVSALMDETIRIDTSNAGQVSNSHSAPTEKAESDLPYFYIQENIWRKFFNEVTAGMFFNNTMDLGVNKCEDDQSGIAQTEYVIKYLDQPYKTQWELMEGVGEGEWNKFSGTASIPETTGYIYVRITNGAGLHYCLRSEPWITFDTQGPVVQATFNGELHRGEAILPEDGQQEQMTDKTINDGDEIIADNISLKISDEQKLLDGSEDASKVAIRIFAGTSASIDGQSGNVLYKETITDGSKEVSGIEIKASDLAKFNGYCTVIAKDNSGLVTTRVFKLKAPEFGMKVKNMRFDGLVYGAEPDQELTLGYEQTGNARPTIESVDPGDEFTATKESTNVWKIKPKAKLDARTHVGNITVRYNGGKEAKATCQIAISKKLLVASFEGGTIYKGQKLTQQNGVVSGFIEGSREVKVTGFVDGEFASGAAGYVSPTITIPEYPSETMIVTPKGGSATNYKFDDSSNVGGVITVLTDRAAKNTHYTVEGTLSSTGWYISNIKIKPKAGYNLTKDAAGTGATTEINIYDDTNAGEEKFYIKNAATTGEKAGEIYEQSVFSYKKDVVNPQITGVSDGMTYQENKKAVVVKDDYLYRVAVNGVRQSVTNNKSEFEIMATQTQGTFFITAEDYAGHITTATISLLQPDGTTTDGSEMSLLNEHPEDDIIQDDTEDGTDSDLGTLTRKVQLVDGAPSTTFTSTISELKTGVLNASERAVMREGSDANVKLRVQNVDGSVSQADKELVIAALGDYTVAQYLDITLWKTVGNGEEKQVTSTNNPISVTISIPNSFRSPKSGKLRQFAIVRVHNGSATVLQDKDSSANTITIGTSKFSVYALAYRDVDKSSSSNPGNASSGNNGGSGGGSSNSGSSGSGGSSGSSSAGSPSGSSSGGSGGSSGGGSYGVETGGTPARSVSTGDSAPIVPIAIGFGVAFIGLVTFIIIRRRMNYEWVYLGDDGKYYDKDGNVYEDGE